MTYGLGNRITDLESAEKQGTNKHLSNLVAPMVALRSCDADCDSVIALEPDATRDGPAPL